MYLFFTIILCFSAGFYVAKKDLVHKKARKIRNLFHLVKTQHKNIIKIIWVMLTLISKTIYVWLCQSLNGSFRQLNKNTFEVSYVVGGVMYKMLVKAKRGPRKIICCVDDYLNDFTDELNAYYGPSEDFHGHVFTPDFFHRNILTFSLSNGDEKSFSRHEAIVI
jgi:hypothetical protein